MSSSAKLYEERRIKRNSQIVLDKDKISEEDELNYEEAKMNSISQGEAIEEGKCKEKIKKEVRIIAEEKNAELAAPQEEDLKDTNSIKLQLTNNESTEQQGRRKSSVAELKV